MSLLTDLRSQNVNLSLIDVLHLLRSRVCDGLDMPDVLDKPPWRVTGKGNKVEVINQVLKQSLKVQSSYIPKSGDFENFILSNSSMAVAALLKSYLRALFKEDVCEIVLGVLLWDPAARKDEDDYEGTPYLWLEIGGEPIDNTYVDMPKNEMSLEYFYKAKQINSYVKEDPFKTKLRLYLGQEGTLSETVKHNFRIYREYGNSDHIEKFALFAFASAELNPSVRMYDILMRDFIKKTFDIQVEDLDQKWSSICWQCLERIDPESLKTCSGCKLAKYCGRECQQNEWKRHKLLHKELEFTKKILGENELLDGVSVEKVEV